MKACVLHAVGDLRFEEIPRPVPREGEALVRIEASGICGSDIPRIFKKGTYRFPLVPGHEFAGTVEELGPGVEARWRGVRAAVFPLLPCGRCEMCRRGRYAQCSDYDYFGSRRDGGFAEYAAVPLWNLVPLPGSLSVEAAALCEPAAVACHAVGRGKIQPGDDVFIAGAGTIGLLAALWSRISGASRIILSDISEGNLHFARTLGFPLTVNSAGDVPEFVKEKTGREGVDLSIDCAGVNGAVENCLAAAGPGGRVVLMGNPAGDMTLSQNHYWHILRKELTLRGTWNSSYGGPSNDWLRTVEAMAAGRLDLEPLITHRFGLDRADEALGVMRNRDELSIKVLFEPFKTGPRAR